MCFLSSPSSHLPSLLSNHQDSKQGHFELRRKCDVCLTLDICRATTPVNGEEEQTAKEVFFLGGGVKFACEANTTLKTATVEGTKLRR